MTSMIELIEHIEKNYKPRERLLIAMHAINTLDEQQYAQLKVMLLVQTTKADWEQLMRS